jgi:hypothetical protein
VIRLSFFFLNGLFFEVDDRELVFTGKARVLYPFKIASKCLESYGLKTEPYFYEPEPVNVRNLSKNSLNVVSHFLK